MTYKYQMSFKNEMLFYFSLQYLKGSVLRFGACARVSYLSVQKLHSCTCERVFDLISVHIRQTVKHSIIKKVLGCKTYKKC